MRRVSMFVVTAIAFVALFGFAPNAQAQYASPTGHDPVVVDTRLGVGDAFNAGPTAATTPADLTPDTTTVGGTGGGEELAFTGAESEALAYIGSAMIAVGATVFVAHRRMTRD